jgi:hypothetical protein
MYSQVAQARTPTGIRGAPRTPPRCVAGNRHSGSHTSVVRRAEAPLTAHRAHRVGFGGIGHGSALLSVAVRGSSAYGERAGGRLECCETHRALRGHVDGDVPIVAGAARSQSRHGQAGALLLTEKAAVTPDCRTSSAAVASALGRGTPALSGDSRGSEAQEGDLVRVSADGRGRDKATRVAGSALGGSMTVGLSHRGKRRSRAISFIVRSARRQRASAATDHG